jgi:transcriptional regulator with AAA-type ATPase domain
LGLQAHAAWDLILDGSMSGDSTASFSEIAGGMIVSSARLIPGFVSGSPAHGLPELKLDGLDTLDLGRGTETTLHRERRALRVELADRWVSTPHLRLYRQHGDWQIEDCGAKNGFYLNGGRAQGSELVDGDVIELGASFFVFREDATKLPALDDELRAPLPNTHSTQLRDTYHELRTLAPSELPILINGDTGTGKELAAAFIHGASNRTGPLYPINCAAIPVAVSESFLFGHKRGAFSGAIADHGGVIRAAEGGTLFLDEVAELDQSVQGKLLRVLQERLVTPMGGTRSVPVSVRVVSATHVDLDDLVAKGRFRQDLLARLAGHRAKLPALRQRKEDLGLLVRELLGRRLREGGDLVTFERAATRALYAYDWPNNVRELDQALHKCVLANGQAVSLAQLPEQVRNAQFAERPSLPPSAPSEQVLLQTLTGLLREHRGNVSAVARDMGKARVQIRRWCRRLQLDPADFRSS